MAVQDSNPFPLGFVTTTPGTPVGLLVNYPGFASSDTPDVNFIYVQAHSENLGRCFLGNKRLNVLTGEGLIHTFMGAGDSFVLSSIAVNVYRLDDFRIDVEFAGDGVNCSVYVR